MNNFTCFLKTLCHGEFNMLKYLQNDQNSRKTENVSCAKICAKYIRKNCAICILLFKTFNRALKCRNPMTESRSKYRFSLVKVK